MVNKSDKMPANKMLNVWKVSYDIIFRDLRWNFVYTLVFSKKKVKNNSNVDFSEIFFKNILTRIPINQYVSF